MKFVVAVTALLLWSARVANAQLGYPTTLDRPNPADFVGRTDTELSFAGSPLREAGMNVPWLALFTTGTKPGNTHYPTRYEIDDLLKTVQVMGGTAIRVLSAGASVGCAQCIMPAPGKLNEDALKTLDLVLREARDKGIKVIIPLAGPGTDCGAAAPYPVTASSCVFAAWRGKKPEAFFTDPDVKADFQHYVTSLLTRVNSLTQTIYYNDPTILAWENCDACGVGVAPATVAAWTEELGRSIKALDRLHLYENGAFAGHLVQSAPGAVPTSLLALPSVDMIGDQIIPALPGTTAPGAMNDAADAVTKAGRVYFIDAYGWTAKDWPTPDDFEHFLTSVVHRRSVAGALVTNFESHADQGGYLPVPADSGPESALYFPGKATQAATWGDMQARGRVARRFDYRFVDLPILEFAVVESPKILHVEHGRIVWQGAAGASAYKVERSQDPHIDGSWTVLCKACASDAAGFWQDPNLPADPPWYRLSPLNANAHEGVPSDPVQSK
jgi:hypothetical protein